MADHRIATVKAREILDSKARPMVEVDVRTAGGARIRLGVKAAVGRILVLAAAVVAELERRHRRPRAVVRHRLDDRQPGPALRAVEERVAVAAVGRVEELTEARVAGGDVRRDQRRVARRDALDDPELALPEWFHDLAQE